MKKIFNPIYSSSNDASATAHLKDSNQHASSIAGFNWRNVDFPYAHNHTHWEILLVVKGKTKHVVNGKQQIATKGYVCLIRPDDVHKITFDDKKSETLTFGFSNDIAEKLLAPHTCLHTVLEQKEPLSFVLNNATFESVLSKALAAQFFPKELYEQYTILIVNRLLLAFVEQKLNKTEAYPDWLNNFLAYLRNPENLKQSIPEIAKHSSYSYQHLSLLFKKYLGKTLVDYIKELKLTLAKEALLNTNKTVTEIALDLNYESTSSLNHNFKKATGLSPLEFRKNNATSYVVTL